MTSKDLRQYGFTLIEVLIAMAIFAVLSVMTFQALEGTMRAQERVEKHAQELTSFQVAWSIITKDFTNITRRPVRGVFGELNQAFIEEDEDCQITFTRVSGLNSELFYRSGMQRVAYCVEDGNLYRMVWPQLDLAESNQPQKGLLIEGVEDFLIEIDPPLERISEEDALNASLAQYEVIPRGKMIIEITTEKGIYRRSFLATDIQ